jgi:hypothetical protein
MLRDGQIEVFTGCGPKVKQAALSRERPKPHPAKTMVGHRGSRPTCARRASAVGMDVGYSEPGAEDANEISGGRRMPYPLRCLE